MDLSLLDARGNPPKSSLCLGLKDQAWKCREKGARTGDQQQCEGFVKGNRTITTVMCNKELRELELQLVSNGV